MNIADLDAQARAIAQKNAADSAALEAQYNPGASELRSGSLEALLASMDPASRTALTNLAMGGAPGVSTPGARSDLSAVPARDALGALHTRGDPSAANADLLARVAAQAGQPLTNNGFDSALTRAAVAQAQADLALGGQLPQDVRNLIARTAAARSGSVSGGLGLGRDMTARDLGLTSLDLRNQRLSRAAQLGSQEAGLEQANAAMRAQSEQFGRTNLLQSQGALAADEAFREQQFGTDAQIQAARDALLSQQYSTDAQIRAQQDALRSQNYGTDAQLAAQRDALASSNYFNQGALLQNIASGDFARAFQAAQLGQNITPPMSGLDPGSVVNLAVGNSNLAANSAQQAAALQAQAGNQKMQLGSQLLGTGLGFAQNYMNTPKPYVAPATTYSGGYGYNVN